MYPTGGLSKIPRSFVHLSSYFPQPTSNTSGANTAPIPQDLDEDQSASIPDVNNLTIDHDPEDICAPDPRPGGSESGFGPAASNQGSSSFRPAPLDLDKGESETGIYIPAL